MIMTPSESHESGLSNGNKMKMNEQVLTEQWPHLFLLNLSRLFGLEPGYTLSSWLNSENLSIRFFQHFKQRPLHDSETYLCSNICFFYGCGHSFASCHPVLK